MNNAVKSILTIVFLTSLSVQISAQGIEKTAIKKVDSLFSSYFNSTSPGAAIAVLHKGEIVFKKTAGLANVEHQIPITDTTVFNIASNSKQMTTLLALVLQEEGKLSFEDDIRKHLPELKDLQHKITIKQLTNHTHGLPNVDEIAHLKGKNLMHHYEVVEMLLNIRSHNYLPGQKFEYNNTGYVLLSEIIERAGKKPFDALLKEKVLEPLGMQHSRSVGYYDETIVNKAYSYRAISSGYIESSVTVGTQGASGVYACLDDLIAYSQNFVAEDAWHANHLEKMQQATALNNGDLIDYGMGIQFENYKGVDIVFHGGGTNGYRSYMLHAPAHELSLIFLSNNGGFEGYGIMYSALETLLGSNIEVPTPSFKTKLTAFEGTYELTPGNFQTIWAEQDSLFFKTNGSNERIFLPRINDNTFKFNQPYSKLIFNADGFKMRFVDFTYVATRTEAPTSMEDLEQYVGIYKNKEHDVTYELVLVDGKIVAKHCMLPDVALDTYSKNCLYAKSSYFGRVDFVRRNTGEVTGFKLSRQYIANMHFSKQ